MRSALGYGKTVKKFSLMMNVCHWRGSVPLPERVYLWLPDEV